MKRDQKLYVASFCGLGLTVVSGMALSQVPEGALAVDSVDKSVSASVTVATACTMTGKETDAHTKTVQPGTYTAGIGSTTLTVTCNDPGGFDIYAVGFSGDTWGNTKMLYGGTGSDWDIVTGTAESGNTSNWAMKLTAVDGDYKPTIMSVAPNNYTSYHAVPSDATKVASFASATNVVDGSKMTTTYAVHVSSAQVAGTYEGKVKYSLVHPVGAPAPEKPVCVGYNKMQDIASLKDTLFTAVGTQVQLCDTRDEKIYYAAKLADGNVWMTQNLDLDLSTTKILTSADTDLVADTTYTPAVSTTTGNTFSSSDYTGENSWDGGNYYWKGTWNGSSQNSNLGYSYFNTYFSTDIADAGAAAEHYHVGNLYQWSAATAKTGNGLKSGAEATSSICPKGWRLPYSGDTTSKYAFGTMLTAYDYVNWSDKKQITQSPLFFVPAGFVASGRLYAGAYFGYYWSSRAYSDSTTFSAYYLDFGSSSINPSSSSGRCSGFSVRCVAR